MKVLLEFITVFYKEKNIIQQAKTENILELLTPSEEAFILLLIVVYFEDHADTTYAENYEGTSFIEKMGWQEAGIHLYNSLYMKVKTDRATNGKKFDRAFRLYYQTLTGNAESKNKRKEKRNLPIALNDLD